MASFGHGPCRRRLVGHQAHANCRLAPDAVQGGQQARPGGDLRRSLRPGQPEGGGVDDDHRGTGVHQRGLHGAPLEQQLVRWPSPWATGSRWSGPRDRGTTFAPRPPGRARLESCSVPSLLDVSARRRHLLHDQRTGVGVVHADRRQVPGRADPPAPERVQPDHRRAVPAVAPPVDDAAHRHRPGRRCSRRRRPAGRRRREDHRLARRRSRSSDAVDLTRVGAAEDPEQHRMPCPGRASSRSARLKTQHLLVPPRIQVAASSRTSSPHIQGTQPARKVVVGSGALLSGSPGKAPRKDCAVGQCVAAQSQENADPFTDASSQEPRHAGRSTDGASRRGDRQWLDDCRGRGAELHRPRRCPSSSAGWSRRSGNRSCSACRAA